MAKIATENVAIYSIQKYLESNHKLYSCLFVNRQWCSIAMQLIWADPFIKNSQKRKADHPVKIFFKCLDDESKLILSQNGLRTNEIQTKPLFQYAGFLKVIDFDILIKMALHFCGYPTISGLRYDRVKEKLEPVLQVLLMLFSKQSHNLKYAKICHVGMLNIVDFAHLFDSSHGKALLDRITHVKRLVIRPSRRESCLRFAERMKHLETLTITFLYKVVKDFPQIRRELIKNTAEYLLNLRNLKSFELIGQYSFEDYSTIIEALGTHRQTLCNVEFRNLNFKWTAPLLPLAGCEQLQQLAFHNCSRVDDQLCEPLFTAKLPHLTSVKVLHGPSERFRIYTEHYFAQKHRRLIKWTKKITGIAFNSRYSWTY
ncbi:hypothetical protein G9A89_000615 [Geosiphon pyriformis]|nr:hypothetical protein G9A89_000615 [Geosiphon pyriformis]